MVYGLGTSNKFSTFKADAEKASTSVRCLTLREEAWPSGQSAGLEIWRSRVQDPL